MTSPGHRRRIDAYGICTDGAGRTLLVPAGADANADSDADSGSAGVWLLPGDRVRHGEHPAATVLRAMQAQTGRSAALLRVRDVIADVAPPDAGAAVHHDRILFDATVSDGPTGRARWMTPDELAAVPLAPFVAAALGVPASPPAPRPPAPPAQQQPPDDAADDPRRRQRFAAYALVTDPADRILLTRIAPGYPGAGRWHLPGGGTDFGESPLRGVLRELYEESGQRGRVTGVLGISHRRNAAALGPEGHPIDWHAVRVLYRVLVDVPTAPAVTEAAGSTAAAAWFPRAALAGLPTTEVVAEATRALPSGTASTRL